MKREGVYIDKEAKMNFIGNLVIIFIDEFLV